MRNLMDNVPTYEEAQNLKKYMEDSMLELSESVQNSITQQYDKANVVGLEQDSVLNETDWKHFDKELSVQAFNVKHTLASHAVSTVDVHSLRKLIEQSKSETKNIIQVINSLPTEKQKKEYILRAFCVSTLTSYRKLIAQYSFQANPKVVAKSYQKTKWGYLAVVFVPLYFLFIALFVFIYGVSIGPEATYAWLVGAFVCMAIELLIFRPALVLTKSIFLPSFVSKDIQVVYSTLAKRTRFIMLRRYGLMKHANARIQHVSCVFYSTYIPSYP